MLMLLSLEIPDQVKKNAWPCNQIFSIFMSTWLSAEECILTFHYTAKLDIKVKYMLQPRKISCSRLLAQALDSTALPKNAQLTYG